MDLRGQRFTIDLSEDEDETGSSSSILQTAGSTPSPAFIGDVIEKSTAPPTAPKLKSTSTGFPEHKKRTRISAFKSQRAGAKPISRADDAQTSGPSSASQSAGKTSISTDDGLSYEDTERQKIDAENKRRLASMTAEEIEEERRDLLAGLDPSLIEKFLKRANLDDGRGDTGIDPPATIIPAASKLGHDLGEVEAGMDKNKSTEPATAVCNIAADMSKEDKEGIPAPKPTGQPFATAKSVTFADDAEPGEPIGLQPASGAVSQSVEVTQPAVHFPNAPSAPELDPSDPSFLENLHSKYFPSLPADPSKLAWMAPIPSTGSIADQESPYYPANEALSASALRFDFRGGILPPRISRAMPISKGLHHHGEAPEAAGYTVPELARLARSAFPAQRCVAFQTLGRILYRLGKGVWGDQDSEITKGLWQCMEGGKVVQTLEEAANAEGGHQGSKVYAVEAVWLWQKGGGHVWKTT
ncbi:transcription factor [Phlyctema vagabunda]|uniref:Transcription factor n=1 Tax=Phlyctema vagabunda TaxID=108571 RepID=A0ABR4PSD7_9HELO